MKKEIIKAIASGNLEFIKEHIDASQLNEKDAFGFTYLNHAINRSQTEIAMYLIQRGANIHTLDEYGNTTFMLALSKGDFTLAEQLYKLGVNTNARNTAGVCAFSMALKSRGKDLIQFIFNKCSFDINSRDDDGRTLLMKAALWNDVDFFLKVLAKKPNLNQQSDDGSTPLILAAKNKNDAMVQTLVDKGADVNLKDHIKNSALIYAVQKNAFKIVEIIVKAGAQINWFNDRGESACTLAIKKRKSQLLSLLFENGTINTQEEKNNLLYRSVKADNGVAVNWLIKSGIDYQHPTFKGLAKKARSRFGNSLLTLLTHDFFEENKGFLKN